MLGLSCEITEKLSVKLTAVDGEGDITLYSRKTMQSFAKDPDIWNDRTFCSWACATTGGVLMHIESMSMDRGAYLHELFHNFGLGHGNGLMGKNGGTLTAANIDSLGRLYGL